MQIFYIIYCILCYVEYFPRIIKLYKTKSSVDYSLTSTIISFIGLVCWMVYLFTTEQDFILYLGCIVDMMLNMIFVILVFRYHDNKTNANHMVNSNPKS